MDEEENIVEMWVNVLDDDEVDMGRMKQRAAELGE